MVQGGEFRLFEVEAGSEVFGAFMGKVIEVFFNSGLGGGIFLDSLIDFKAFAQIAENSLQTLGTETLDEELDDERGFIIGKLEVHLGGWGKKGGAELGDGRQL